VHSLPGFDQGLVSVQDAGAQWRRACSSPAGRPQGERLAAYPCGARCVRGTRRQDRPHSGTHRCELDALDLDVTRLARVRKTSIGCSSPPRSFRATPRSLTPGGMASCSTAFWPTCRVPPPAWCGAIRHQVAASADDIAQFSRATGVMLEALWRLLAPGGTLLYATCSLFEEENDGQVRAFLARHAGDAERCPLPELCPTGRCCLMPSMMVSLRPAAQDLTRRFAGWPACCWLLAGHCGQRTGE